MQTEDFPALDDAQNQGLTVARGGGELHSPAADDVNTPRCLTFYEQDCALGIRAGVLNFLQVLQRIFWEIAKETGVTQFTNEAILGDLKPVR